MDFDRTLSKKESLHFALAKLLKRWNTGVINVLSMDLGEITIVMVTINGIITIGKKWPKSNKKK